MKNLKILLSAITTSFFTILSCNKDSELVSLSSVEGTHLSLTKVNNLIPDVYQGAEKVTFKNKENQLVELNVFYEQEVEERILGENIEYTSESVSATLFNYQENIEIVVSASANYNDNSLEVLETLNVILMPGYNSVGGGWISLLYKDSELMEFDTFTEELDLLDRPFNNVYVNKLNSDLQTEYSEIYYNADYGVIGFKDKFNELWVLED